MENCKPKYTPIEKDLLLTSDKNNITSKPYCQLLGCLMCIMIGTRPDLSFSVTFFGQYQNEANDEHYNHLTRVLKYLTTPAEYKIHYNCSAAVDNPLQIFDDASWAPGTTLRKSITAFASVCLGT